VAIFSPEGERVADTPLSVTSLASKQAGKIIGFLAQPLSPGHYTATAKIDYDGRTVSFSQNFSVSRPHIKVLGLDAGDFRPGQVSRFDIDLQSEWNMPLEAYGELTLLKAGSKVVSGKTESFTIMPGEQRALTAYLDTQAVPPDADALELVLRYPGGETRHIEMFPKQAPVTLLRQSAALLAAIGVLAFLNLFWYYYIRKRLKRRPSR
jgi:hypothetical protein